MKILKSFLFLSALVILAFTSCEKEVLTTEVEVETVTPTETDQNGLLNHVDSRNETIELACLTIDMPFDMEMLDGSTATLNNATDLENLFSNATEDSYPVDFVYPITATDEDGNSLTLNTADELGEAFVECIPDEGWGGEVYPDEFFPAWEISLENSCYDLVYPVDLEDIEGNQQTVNDEAALVSTLSDGNLYSFVFPISLTDIDGNVVTAADGDELFDTLGDCYPDTGGFGLDGFFGCYELGYPAVFVDYDGNEVTVNNDDEFSNLFLSGGCYDFGFPLTLIDEEGNETVINNEEELYVALSECEGTWGGDPDGGEGDICFEFALPYTLQNLITGEQYVIASEEDWNSVPMNEEPVDFVYPITITYIESGESVTVNSPEEMGIAFEECF